MMIERPHRLEDWRPRLESVVREWRDRRWRFGEIDCAQFVAAAIMAQTGRQLHLPDYADKDRKAAISGLVSTAREMAMQSGYRIAEDPVAGDAGVFHMPSNGFRRGEWTLGVMSFEVGTVWVPRMRGLRTHDVTIFARSRIYAVGV